MRIPKKKKSGKENLGRWVIAAHLCVERKPDKVKKIRAKITKRAMMKDRPASLKCDPSISQQRASMAPQPVSVIQPSDNIPQRSGPLLRQEAAVSHHTSVQTQLHAQSLCSDESFYRTTSVCSANMYTSCRFFSLSFFFFSFYFFFYKLHFAFLHFYSVLFKK